MKEMIASIYNIVSDIVQPFKALYPYQDIEADVDGGVVTFAPKKIKNLTLSGERLLNPSVDLVKNGFSGKPLNPYASDSTSCALAGERLLNQNDLCCGEFSHKFGATTLKAGEDGKGAGLGSPLPVLIDAVTEVCFEVDIYKTIEWNTDNMSAFDMAERLQTYLKSSQARDKFYNDYKYELMPIWADIILQADFNTYKKWVQIAQFEMFITKMSKVELSDTVLKKVVVEVNEVGILKTNPAYTTFADRYLKTN